VTDLTADDGDGRDRPSRGEANHGDRCCWCHGWPQVVTLVTQVALLVQAVLPLVSR
jgi:hypothetical protein